MSTTGYVTIVTKKHQFSIHSSFKKACEAYEWDYDSFKGKPTPSKIDDYGIKRHPKETTIDCIEMIERCAMCKEEQIHEYEGMNWIIEFPFGEPSYFVEVEVKEVLHTVGDPDNETDEYFTEPTKVVSVWSYNEEHDDDKVEVKVDEYTKDQLLNLVDFSE